MDVTHPTDDGQTTLWNGAAGRAWVDAQEVFDRIFKPLDKRALTSSRPVA